MRTFDLHNRQYTIPAVLDIDQIYKRLAEKLRVMPDYACLQLDPVVQMVVNNLNMGASSCIEMISCMVVGEYQTQCDELNIVADPVLVNHLGNSIIEFTAKLMEMYTICGLWEPNGTSKWKLYAISCGSIILAKVV